MTWLDNNVCRTVVLAVTLYHIVLRLPDLPPLYIINVTLLSLLESWNSGGYLALFFWHCEMVFRFYSFTSWHALTQCNSFNWDVSSQFLSYIFFCTILLFEIYYSIWSIAYPSNDQISISKFDMHICFNYIHLSLWGGCNKVPVNNHTPR